MQRRHFLKAAGAAALAPWGAMQALAQTAPAGGEYRALVCLFLYGGNDGNNLLVPIDEARHARYQAARPNLALDRASLLPLSLQGQPGAQRYGLHPSLGGLQRLVNEGHASLVANVGPLMVPTTKAQYQAGSVPLPANLFSHSDQQGAWQSGLVDAPPRSGWGGRLLERVVDTDTPNRGYSAISVAGGNVWETGDLGLTAYRVSSSGRFGLDFYQPGSTDDPLSAAITGVLAQSHADPFAATWTNLMGRSIENQRVLTEALANTALGTVFPGTGLGAQLQMIARLIAARDDLGLARQCFFCSIGGFDTHGDDQLAVQAQAFQEIGDAVAAFHEATVSLGVSDRVTLFSASDFGRNLPSNGAGTDHGWGNHHFVVGDALQGARLFGRFPEMAVGGDDDAGQGVWIPSTACDQLGDDLATWFGSDAAVRDAVFPRRGDFPALGLFG